jgi:hypothetical protein
LDELLSMWIVARPRFLLRETAWSTTIAGWVARRRRQARPAGEVFVARLVRGASFTTPESIGVSTERLGQLHQGMQAFVDRHEVGGIVTLVAREGKVVDINASGFQDLETRSR